MKRSKWKGFFIKPKRSKTENRLSAEISRNSLIVPTHTGKTFTIHNGKSFKNMIVLKDMIGHKFGEFFKTRVAFEYKKKKKK
jgi:small subunit ribosomal protein S19